MKSIFNLLLDCIFSILDVLLMALVVYLFCFLYFFICDYTKKKIFLKKEKNKISMFNPDTNLIIGDVFEIDIPDNFRNISKGNYEIFYEMVLDSKSVDSNCGIYFSALIKDGSIDIFCKEFASYFGCSEVSKVIINNIEWYRFETNDSIMTWYFYLTKVKDKIYLYEFSFDKKYYVVCPSYHDAIINSIKLR